MTLYVVRTDLDFVEIFLRPPRWDATREEWMDFGRVYVFGTLYWRQNTLATWGVLQPNVPRAMTLGAVPVEGPEGWTFQRNGRGHLEFHVNGAHVETYCRKTCRAFRMHRMPVGLRLALRWEPFSYGELATGPEGA